jgi:hypothetical protein
MAAADPNDRIPSDESDPKPPVNRLAGRVRFYFDRRPAVTRKKFLLDAVRRDFDFHTQRETETGAGPARWYGEGPNRWPTARPALSAEDIRLHAWLNERLAVLHYERHGLWPKLRRFLFGNRLVRWLGLGPQRTGDGRKG